MHRPAASRQYLHAPLIVEAAQHRAQDIDVTVPGNAHGRVTRDALDPSGDIISQTHALDHAGDLEQHATNQWVSAEQTREERAAAPADVNHDPGRGEVVGVDSSLERLDGAVHRGAVHPGSIGVGSEIVVERLPERQLEPRLPVSTDSAKRRTRRSSLRGTYSRGSLRAFHPDHRCAGTDTAPSTRTGPTRPRAAPRRPRAHAIVDAAWQDERGSREQPIPITSCPSKRVPTPMLAAAAIACDN